MEFREDMVIKLAGDSGDGIQLMGTQLAGDSILLGLDLLTFPDFPAEIRAPQGTLAGVSGFQMHISSEKVYAVGESYDVLVALNASALRNTLPNLKKGGLLIVDSAGFEAKNLKLAGYSEDKNPLLDMTLSETFTYLPIPITKLTREALQKSKLTMKERDRAKNMFVLGLLYWIFDYSLQRLFRFLNEKFQKRAEILEANICALKTGYNYGEITEIVPYYKMKKDISGNEKKNVSYRTVSGNTALVYGLVSASVKTKLPLFFGSYPITPASDILHTLSKLKHFNIKTFQAEDEMAAIGAAIGASYAGAIGVTSTSGPGMDLKTEFLGLAVMLEIPLVVIDVQRAGPSTGMPTKMEQSDLLQAFYGRHGESPLPVLACATPVDAFSMAYESVRLTLEFMIPVILLSDANIGNGIQVWEVPDAEKLPSVAKCFKTELASGETAFEPYKRDIKGAREWVIPGTPNLEHRIGGLEKQKGTGNVSYDSDNHQVMVKERQRKVENIAKHIPLQSFEIDDENADILIIGWGSTYGVIRSVTRSLQREKRKIAHIHIRYLNPFPANLSEIINRFSKIIVAEMNAGQLIKILTYDYPHKNMILYNAQPGMPLSEKKLKHFIIQQMY